MDCYAFFSNQKQFHENCSLAVNGRDHYPHSTLILHVKFNFGWGLCHNPYSDNRACINNSIIRWIKLEIAVIQVFVLAHIFTLTAWIMSLTGLSVLISVLFKTHWWKNKLLFSAINNNNKTKYIVDVCRSQRHWRVQYEMR